MTVALSVSLRGGTPFGVPVEIVGRFTGSEGRKGFASGEVIVDGTITAEATAIYVQERRPEARISGAGTLRRPSRGPSGPAPEAP